MHHQLKLHIGPPPPGEPTAQGERIMQAIERMLTQRRADRIRAERQREEVIRMIRDLDLRDIHERLEELLSTVPQQDHSHGFIPILITTCLSFARAIDHLQERESSDTWQTLHDIQTLRAETNCQIRSLRTDLAAVQALIRK